MLTMNKMITSPQSKEATPQSMGGLFGASLIPVTAVPLSGMKYDFDISEIGHSEDFQQLLQVLRFAQEEDEIHLHINSPGGSLFTAVQICTAIAGSNAKRVSAHAEGLVASAATLIFLGCNQWNISPLASFMFHTSSSVEIGKMPDMLKSIKAHEAHLNVVCGTLYKDFLTEDEIDLIINKNDDMWLTAAEATERLEHMIEVQSNRANDENKKIKKVMSIVEDALSTIDEETLLQTDDEETEYIELPTVSMEMKKAEIITVYENLCNELSRIAPDFVPVHVSKHMTKKAIIEVFDDLIAELIEEDGYEILPLDEEGE